MTYMMVEFYDHNHYMGGDPVLVHNAIATAQEIAEHLKDYRGMEHRITGFMTEEEVRGLSYTDRGLAALDEEVADGLRLEAEERTELWRRTGLMEGDIAE